MSKRKHNVLKIEEMPLRLRLAAKAIVWIAAGSLSWFAMLVLSTLFAYDGSAPNIIGFIPISLKYTALLAGPIGILHGIASLLRRHSPRWLLWSSMICAALLSYPAYELASFLCSGDWISTRTWSPLAQAGVLIATLFTAIAAWAWHCAIIPETRRSIATGTGRIARLARFGPTLPILSVVGLVAATVAFPFAMYNLAAYTLLAEVITGGIWFVLATLSFTLLRLVGSSRVPVLVAALAWVVIGSAHAIVESFGEPVPPPTGSRIAALTSIAVTWSPPPAVRFDVSVPAAFDCTQPQQLSRLPPVDIPEARRRNVILIFIDALRKDVVAERLGDRQLLPNLTEFSNNSLSYTNAHTTYPATLFAMASALTGRAPSEVLLAPQIPKNLLALGEERFDSTYISLPADVWFDLPAVDRVLLQGIVPERHYNARRLTERSIEVLTQLRADGRSTLAWIHYYEPHMPYSIHDGFDFGDGPREAYLSEVAYVDDALGQLLEHIDREGWYEDSLVIIAADHGQALGERGYYGHHVYLNNHLTAVPLFLRAPGTSTGTIDDLVSLADVAPTVLHFIDSAVPTDLTGRSLLAKRPSQDAGRTIVAEAFPLRGKRLFDMANIRFVGLAGLRTKIEIMQADVGSYSPKVALIHGPNRLIVDRVTGAIELYDDLKDPDNALNIAGHHPELVESLISQLKEWHTRTSARAYCALLRAGAASR